MLLRCHRIPVSHPIWELLQVPLLSHLAKLVHSSPGHNFIPVFRLFNVWPVVYWAETLMEQVSQWQPNASPSTASSAPLLLCYVSVCTDKPEAIPLHDHCLAPQRALPCTGLNRIPICVDIKTNYRYIFDRLTSITSITSITCLHKQVQHVWHARRLTRHFNYNLIIYLYKI